MLPKALHDAAVDGIARRLRGSDVCLLVVLWGYLDVYEYRELKQAAFLARLRLAAGRRVDAANVRRAVRRLERIGYVERGPKRGRVNTYRLILAPRSAPPQPRS
jgi:hypothetical protein